MEYSLTGIRRRLRTELIEDYPLSCHIPLVHFGLNESPLVGDLTVRDTESARFKSQPQLTVYCRLFIYSSVKYTCVSKRSCRRDVDSDICPLSDCPGRFAAGCPSAIWEWCRWSRSIVGARSLLSRSSSSIPRRRSWRSNSLPHQSPSYFHLHRAVDKMN